MKIISGKELFPYIHGVLSCSLNENGAAVFHRFTETQKERYVETGIQKDLNFLNRACASSGVTLELETDSSFLGLKPVITAACRTNTAFDCHVDGVLYGHWYEEDLSQVPFCFDLPEGMHRVKLTFPWQSIVTLPEIVLDNGAKACPVEKKGRFLAFGDSITQGYITKHPSCGYVNLLASELDYDGVNQAIGGYWFDSLTLDDRLADYKPDFITVAFGTNDYSLMTAPENLTEDCRMFTERLVGIFPGTKILGLIPIWRNDAKSYARNRMRDYKAADAYDAIRKIYEQYPNITILEDTYFPRHDDFLAPDHLHPNDLGNMFYGNAVIKAVKEMLAK